MGAEGLTSKTAEGLGFTDARGGRDGNEGSGGKDVTWKQGSGGSSVFLLSDAAASFSRHRCCKSASGSFFIDAGGMTLPVPTPLEPPAAGFTVPCEPTAFAASIVLLGSAAAVGAGILLTLEAGSGPGRGFCCN